MYTRLTGAKYLRTNSTVAENADNDGQFDFNNGWFGNQYEGSGYISYMFKRAKGFFDVVAYTGTGSAHAENHSLGVVPEMMIVKQRDGVFNWNVYHDQVAGVLGSTTAGHLDRIVPFTEGLRIGTPTATTFTVDSSVSISTKTYIAYLFATLEGISKVGSYTGNGSSQNIACGFSAGARFVLIKRTDATGDWYIWDTERGIVAGNDPHHSLNTTAAQVTSDDSIDPESSGFTVNQVSATNINVSSATYIFLAIA